MTQTFTIDGRDIRFKATMSLTYRYQAQFGEDILTVLWPIIEFMFNNGSEPENALEALKQIKTTDLMNIIWTLAKTADQSIPEPIDWYDKFEHFPIMELAPKLLLMIVQTMKTTEQFKKKLKVEKSKK